MRITTLLLFAGLIAAASCSSDNASSTAPTPGTGTSTSSDGYTISVDSTANGDTVSVATVIPVRVYVTHDGVASAGNAVSWTVNTGHGSVAASSTVTDSTGMATVNWTMGDTAGVNTMTAVIAGASLDLVANAVGATASALAKVSPDSQAVVVGSTVALTTLVVDRFGNPVKNVTIAWSASGGALSATTTSSGADGHVVANFTSPATAGTTFVTASLPGLASVTFKIVGF